jgi:cytochrome c556
MKSLMCLASVTVLVLAAGLAAQRAGASSDDEVPTIKKVMDTLHKGKNSPLVAVKAALKGDSPDWSKLKEKTKLFAEFGAALQKNDPPRGEKADFEKRAKAYAKNAEALDEAVGKEDLKAARSAINKISASCKGCHEAHKGP